MSPPMQRLYDVCLAVVLTALGLAELWLPFDSRQGSGSAALSSAIIVLVGITLTQRRTFPLLAGVVVLWSWPIVFLFAPLYVLFLGQFVPMAVAVFSMARHGRGPVPFLGAAAAGATLLFFDFFVSILQAPGEIVFHWGVFAIVWAFGFGLRRFEATAADSTRRAIDAEVAAAEQAMAAVVEERTRIARELHDIVAHAVSMMVVQAGAAEQVVDDDPDHVRRALATIRDTGTGALADMRRVVAMLRDAAEPGSLAPQPGLDALPRLVEDASSADLAATLDVLGESRPLPAGVDLAAYRIVQEALTNVRRHAAATSVRVELAYGHDELRIEVADDGVGSTDPRAGHGLVGMRERASLYGGRIETATANGSGFVVRAVLPAGPAT